MKELTPEIMEALKMMRDSGLAVVVFTPEELDGANRNRVEDRLIELGWEVISDLK